MISKNEIPTSTFQAHRLPKGKSLEKPNVLILMTDQQRFDTIRAAGFGYMQTPNLDRLAGEGTLYTHAYTPCPICLPARYNLITGLPPRYHGFPDNVFGAVTRIDLPKLPQIVIGPKNWTTC